MIILDSEKILPFIVIVLVIGLSGSIYLYVDSQNDLTAALSYSEYIESELDAISESFVELSIRLENLSDANSELETRIAELESIETITVVEKREVLLNITESGEVRNIILLIGDGMGVGHLSAAEFENGEEALTMSGLPYKSLVSTYSGSAYVTDSAAAGTALATGYKTNNGRISMSTGGKNYTTVIEVAEASGLSTGVVSTTRITHATPACFMTHVSNRNMESIIASQILVSGVEVLLGGGGTYFEPSTVSGAGYSLVSSTSELLSHSSGNILGLFNEGHLSYTGSRNPSVEPSLAQMTEKSIELLMEDPDGFFLMVEGGRIDHASHNNDYVSTMDEVFAFDEAVFEALEFASIRNDTLVLVTADHDTGGLMVVGGYDYTGVNIDWISDDHTGSMVPLYGYGPRAEEIISFKENTDIGEFILELADRKN